VKPEETKMSRGFTTYDLYIIFISTLDAPPLVYWPEFLVSDPEVRVRFPALSDFLRSSGTGTGPIRPRECNSLAS
jgi:hypothetical protein